MTARIRFHPEGVPAAMTARLPDFGRAFAGLRGVEVDRNRLRHVERVVVDGGLVCYVKRFHGVQWKNVLRLRTTQPRAASQAEREFLVARELERLGLTPGRPLAFGDDVGALRERCSLFVSAELPGRSFAEILGDGPPPAQREAMRRAAAQAIARAFRAGVVLPDLSLDHLFWLPGDGADPRRVGLIDFHNARCGAPTRPRELVRALRRLARHAPACDPMARIVTRRERLALLADVMRRLRRSDGDEHDPARRTRWRLPATRALATRLPGPRDHDYDRPGRAERYRARSPARAAREARLLQAVLGRTIAGGSVLDVPAGAGRMAELLDRAGARVVIQADRARRMLASADAGRPRIVCDALRLPLRDRSVDAVLCFRFLHHLPARAAATALAELTRVARHHLIVSFFHPCAWHGLRRRVVVRLTGRADSRFSLTPRRLAAMLAAHGFRVARVRAELPLLRELWVAVATRER